MSRITMAHTIKHRITSKSLLERLGVGFFDNYFNRRLLRWAGHVASMPVDRMLRNYLTGWAEYAQPIGCPQMSWSRTLDIAPNRLDLPTHFGQWSALAADHRVWKLRIGDRAPCPRPSTTLIHDEWRGFFDDPT